MTAVFLEHDVNCSNQVYAEFGRPVSNGDRTGAGVLIEDSSEQLALQLLEHNTGK
jgi:hypothetical protein